MNKLVVTAIVLGLIVVAIAYSGCQEAPPVPTLRGASAQDGDQIFNSAYDTLDTLENFNLQFNFPPPSEGAEPLLDSGLRLVVNQFNQWLAMQRANPSWQVDPLVSTLSEPLQQLRILRLADDLKLQSVEDGNHFLEVSWFRNIGRQFRGQQSDDLARASQLFDWTIRNIQLDEEPEMPYPEEHISNFLLARESLMLGHGDYLTRAWIFMLLARQQDLDVLLLAFPDDKASGGLRPWLTAAVINDQLYLFDTRLGLAIPGPNREGVATLAQVAADDGLLRQLDLEDERYRVKSADVTKLVALVEASPGYLSQRMALIERRLAGERKLALTMAATSLAGRLKSCPQIAEVRLWPLPYERLARRQKLDPTGRFVSSATMVSLGVRMPKPRKDPNAPPVEPVHGNHPVFGKGQESYSRHGFDFYSLWTGRVMHFKGIYIGDSTQDSAMKHYQEMRVHEIDLDRMIRQNIDMQMRANPEAKPEQFAPFRQFMERAFGDAKQNASFWLGLVTYEREKFPAAIDYFEQRCLKDYPDGLWASGAAYNLARTHERLAEQKLAAADKAEDKRRTEEAAALRAEADGHVDKAIALYGDITLPQEHGNRLRARWLREKHPRPAGG